MLVNEIINAKDLPVIDFDAIIVGGGVNTSDSAGKLVSAGAGYIVTGNQIEKLPSSQALLRFTRAIHHA